MCNVARNTVESASLGGEGQGMSRPSEEIFRYPYTRLITPPYKADSAARQTRQATAYLCRSLQSVPRNKKKCHEARFSSFYIPTPSF